MGCCTGRCFVLTICVLQLISTVERQVFDFLGYMWAPIIGNFFQILCVILGFFGTYQYRPRYLIVYIFWSALWIGWNAFIVCLYLEVGFLHKDNSILNMGTGSRSWWEVNGYGCIAVYNASSYTEHGVKRPVVVDNCLLDYQYIEVLHAGIQDFLTLFGFIGACYLLHLFTEEDDSSQNRKQVSTLPYSIEYQTHPSMDNPYQKPMTPRKVKRRSTRSKSGSRRQNYYKNPVTRIMEHSATINNTAVDSSSSNDSYSNLPPPSYSSGQSAPPSYASAASSMNIMGLDSLETTRQGGILNPGFVSHRARSPIDPGRPSPIYMNDSETVI